MSTNDSLFQIISHSGDSLTIEFFASGGGNQDFLDESFGIDNLQVTTYFVGDLNGDNTVNLLDIAGFIDAISTGVFVPAADINHDGVVNLLDVEPFVGLLSGS